MSLRAARAAPPELEDALPRHILLGLTLERLPCSSMHILPFSDKRRAAGRVSGVSPECHNMQACDLSETTALMALAVAVKTTIDRSCRGRRQIEDERRRIVGQSAIS